MLAFQQTQKKYFTSYLKRQNISKDNFTFTPVSADGQTLWETARASANSDNVVQALHI